MENRTIDDRESLVLKKFDFLALYFKLIWKFKIKIFNFLSNNIFVSFISNK